MPITFPTPTFVGQTYSAAGKTWQWNGYAWDSIANTAAIGATGATGATGPAGPATDQTRIAKAWVNFNGGINTANNIAPSGTSLVVTSGSSTGTWNYTNGFSAGSLGVIYFINIGGTNETLGGVNVSTVGIQITSVPSVNQAQFVLLAGPATVSQTVNGNGAASGYAVSSSGIRSSYNVSSVTKNGTGDYTVNFTTPMADANYSASITRDLQLSVQGGYSGEYGSRTNSTFRFQNCAGITDLGYDSRYLNVIIFGN